MTAKRILAAIAILGALAGGTAAATATTHVVASGHANPTSFYHG